MKLTVEGETIGFFDFDYKSISNKIGVSLSGGSDSALMFYLMAKYLKDVTLIPRHAIEEHNNPLKSRPNSIFPTEKVIEYVKNKFPHADIAETYVFEIPRDDEDTLAKARELNQPGWKHYPMSDKGVAKILHMEKDWRNAYKTGMYGFLCGGTTMNPPQEVLDSFTEDYKINVKTLPGKHPKKFWYEVRRSKVNYQGPFIKKDGMSSYKPFAAVDKKFLAGIYEQEGIMDLHHLTESCTGYAADTNWFTEPCKKCFWCYERKWAFGSYE